MFRKIAIISIGLAAIVNLNAGEIQLGQIISGVNYGLTRQYMTTGLGSIGTATLSNYDAVLFANSTLGGVSPVPFAGYSNTSGTAATPGSTVNAVSNGVTFAMIGDTATPSDADYWTINGDTPVIVIPVGVFGVKTVWTMMNNAFGPNGVNDTDVTFSFGSSANDTGADVQTVTLDLVDGTEIRDAVDCTNGGTSCTSLDYAETLTLLTGVSNSGSTSGILPTVNVAAENVYSAAYNAGSSGPYASTTGNVVLDETGFGFGSAFAGSYLVSIKISDVSGGSNSDTSVSAITLMTAVPEPSTVALFMAGLGVIGFTRLRRNRGLKQN